MTPVGASQSLIGYTTASPPTGERDTDHCDSEHPGDAGALETTEREVAVLAEGIRDTSRRESEEGK